MAKFKLPKYVSPLTVAFRALRKKGYFARQNFSCCGNCALYEMPEGTTNYIFYTKQGNEQFNRTGKVYCSWGGDAQLIVNTLRENGIHCSWAGDVANCILISDNPLPEDKPVDPVPPEADSLAPVIVQV